MRRCYKTIILTAVLMAVCLAPCVQAGTQISSCSFPDGAVIFLPTAGQIALQREEPSSENGWLDARLLLTLVLESESADAMEIAFQLKSASGAILPMRVWNDASQQYGEGASVCTGSGVTLNLLAQSADLVLLKQTMVAEQPQTYALEVLGLTDEPVVVANVTMVKLAEMDVVESGVDYE